MPTPETPSIETIINNTFGLNLETQLAEIMDSDDRILPLDTMLRLSVIGTQATDENGEHLRSLVLGQVIDYTRDGTPLGGLAASLLSDSPPDVMRLDPHSFARQWLNLATADYDGPVYAKQDLVDAVKQRRNAEGKTIKQEDEFLDITRINVRNWTETSVASGIAHSVWRQLLHRARPEWMSNEGLQQFWTPKVSKTHQGTRLKVELDAQFSVMRRELVASALFTDELLLELHEEATTTGIKGIGRVGVHDLETMLSEQHPTTFAGAA